MVYGIFFFFGEIEKIFLIWVNDADYEDVVVILPTVSNEGRYEIGNN